MIKKNSDMNLEMWTIHIFMTYKWGINKEHIKIKYKTSQMMSLNHSLSEKLKGFVLVAII